MAYKPNIAIYPGRTILSILKKEKMTQKSLGERTGLSEKHLSQIINGEASITVETALLLENALGGSASFWINLEKNYQETKARIERGSLLKKEVDLVKNFPYSELAKRGYVELTTNKEKKVENLWRFFGVNSLLSIQKIEPIAWRKRGRKNIKSEAIATWLRCGELQAKEIALPEFSGTLLKQSLSKLKKITRDFSENFSEDIQKTLKQCGVAIVYESHFSGTGVSGAVRWINGKPLIQLSLFGSRADMLIFNLFHEIGHIILHGRKDKFIKYEKDIFPKEKREKEADEFASNELISPEKYNAFIKDNYFTKDKIINFANSIEVNPSVVVGRLCHDKLIKYSSFSKLRPLLKFKENKK